MKVIEGIAEKYAGKNDLKSAEAEFRERVEAEAKYWDAKGDEAIGAEERKTLIDNNKRIEELEHSIKESREAENLRMKNAGRRSALNEPTNRLPGNAGGNTRSEAKTYGDMFLNDSEVKAWFDQIAPNGHIASKTKIHSPSIEVKTLISGSSDTSAGAFIRSAFDSDVSLPTRMLTIRDIITIAETGSDLVEYVEQTSRTNNAASRPEPTLITKPLPGEAAFAWAKRQAAVKNIATWVPATRQALADAPQMRSIINTELVRMVEEELEDQIIAGDGVGSNLLGLLNTSGITTQAYDATGKPLLTTTRKARTKAKTVGRANPNAYVLNPYDWEAIDLLTDGEDRYLFGGPSILGNPRLWGLPVIESEAVPQGTGITGDLRQAKLWDRQQAQILLSDSHEGFFLEGLIAILCELRAAFGVKRPAAVVSIALTAP
jgi:HK97 family phage major capsid protein